MDPSSPNVPNNNVRSSRRLLLNRSQSHRPQPQTQPFAATTTIETDRQHFIPQRSSSYRLLNQHQPLPILLRPPHRRLRSKRDILTSTPTKRNIAENEARSSKLLSASQVPMAVAQLQLPHMPEPFPEKMKEAIQALQQQQTSQRPPLATLKFLLVADVDLASSAALAEYLVRNDADQRAEKQQNGAPPPVDSTSLDLCVVCGSIVRDSDLEPYQTMASRHRTAQRRRKLHTNAEQPPPPHPFLRPPEQTAALKGLVTAALSQLESIVCRVVYVPGASDPLDVITSSQKERRLTPNSRNIHQQWLPLAPALGCTGMCYLGGLESLLASASKQSPPTSPRRRYSDTTNVDDTTATEQTLSNEVDRLQQGYVLST